MQFVALPACVRAIRQLLMLRSAPHCNAHHQVNVHDQTWQYIAIIYKGFSVISAQNYELVVPQTFPEVIFSIVCVFIQARRIASHLPASHDPALHRIASHLALPSRIASHLTASYRNIPGLLAAVLTRLWLTR